MVAPLIYAGLPVARNEDERGKEDRFQRNHQREKGEWKRVEGMLRKDGVPEDPEAVPDHVNDDVSHCPAKTGDEVGHSVCGRSLRLRGVLHLDYCGDVLFGELIDRFRVMEFSR